MAVFEQSREFGRLLRRHRLAVGLSQMELAERSAMSQRGVSDLERGVRRPHPGTARRLAVALQLAAPVRADFLSAASWRLGRSSDRKYAHTELPTALSSFVGRKHELARIRALLETTRLLTLTGTGGVGKSRLAVEVARGIAAEQDQRVCLVELAAITENSAVARAVAAALGLPDQSGHPPLETLKCVLRNDVMLLILDNCEQVLQGCAELAGEVLSGCPGMRILATSRERLGIVGENTWRVPSMALPAEAMPLAEMSACDATQLFLQRAMALGTDFALSDENSRAVARVCIHLGGVPLAIELAAAQLTALSIQQIAQELDDALRLLVWGNRVALPRQQTLRATITWSYDLLDPEERLLFDRLSVFAGGWSLDAAKAVCADPENTGSEIRICHHDVVGQLARLVSKSLVIANPTSKGSMRYSMLETLRQYGHEQLVEHAELHVLHDRHAAHFLSWARAHMSPTDTMFPLTETLVELDNLRVALRWLIDQRDTNRGLELGAALRWFWFRQGRLSEGSEWCLEILALPGPLPETEQLGHVLAAAALGPSRQGKASDAERLQMRALELWRKLGNDYELARSLSQLGNLYRHTARSAEAYRCFDEGISLSGKRDFRMIEGLNRIGLAETLYDDERFDDALAQAGLALDRVERQDYALGMAWYRRAVGLIHYELGARPLARRLLEESLKDARRADGQGWWLADSLACVAQLDVDDHRFGRGRTLLREALELSITLGDQRMIVRCLERLAYLATARSWFRRAIRLVKAADSLRVAAGLPRAPVESKAVRRWLEPAELSLDPAVREQLGRGGTAMSLESVLAYALER
jgi:predicted ATPase